MRRIVQRFEIAAVVAAALCVVTLGAQQAPQTPSWPKFHGTTDDQQKQAVFFDLKGTPLKPNTSRSVGSDKDNPPPGPPLTYVDFLQAKVCSSELVVVGTPKSKQSFLTVNETSIFTDYDVAVTEWVRGGPGNRQPGAVSTLTVALVGGRIDTEDGALQVTDDPPLTLNQPYLLFLKHIPSAASLQLEAPTLEIGAAITALKGHRRVPSDLTSGNRQSSAVLADVRQFVAKCPRGGAQ